MKKWKMKRRMRLDGFPKKLGEIMYPELGKNYFYNPRMKPEGLVNVNTSMYVRMMGPFCEKTKVILRTIIARL